MSQYLDERCPSFLSISIYFNHISSKNHMKSLKSGSAELLCGSVTEPWVCAFSRSKKAQIKCKSARSIHWELEQMTRHVVLQQKRHFRQSFFGCLSIAKLFRTIVGLSWLTRWRRFCSNVLPTPLTRFARRLVRLLVCTTFCLQNDFFRLLF